MNSCIYIMPTTLKSASQAILNLDEDLLYKVCLKVLHSYNFSWLSANLVANESFSVLDIIQSFLRHTKAQEQLSSLAYTSIKKQGHYWFTIE